MIFYLGYSSPSRSASESPSSFILLDVIQVSIELQIITFYFKISVGYFKF